MAARSKKRNIIIISVIVIIAVAAGIAATRGGNGKGEEKSLIRTEKASIADIQVKVTEVGTVEPEVKVDVKSAVSGKVTDIYVRPGDVVDRGHLLARVEPDLNQAQSLAETKNALRSAEITFNEAKKNYEADRQLFMQGLLAPKAQRDTETQYLAAKQQYETAREKYSIVEQSGIPISQSAANFQGSNITAPMRGVVLTKNVEIGESITSGVSSFNAGTVLFSVADTSSMIVKAGVNEVDIGKIHLGQPVKVTLDAFPKVFFAGKIERIAPAVRLDDKVRVFDVEIRLDAQGKELRSGMTANIEVAGERKEKVLTVPVEAVFQRDDQEIVFVKKAVDPNAAKTKKKVQKTADGLEIADKDAWKEKWEKRPVVSGLSDNSRVEILSGLKQGEEVALEDVTLPKKDKDEEED